MKGNLYNEFSIPENICKKFQTQHILIDHAKHLRGDNILKQNHQYTSVNSKFTTIGLKLNRQNNPINKTHRLVLQKDLIEQQVQNPKLKMPMKFCMYDKRLTSHGEGVLGESTDNLGIQIYFIFFSSGYLHYLSHCIFNLT